MNNVPKVFVAMEQIYALGISIIEFIQEWFDNYHGYFELLNKASNPHYAVEWGFPLVSILDSVFAAQLLLCLSFGGWLNAVLKWWLKEDRPYWWIHETDFYEDRSRPIIIQHEQTCETGPGCPSGHSQNIAMQFILAVCWIEHIMNDRKCSSPFWKWFKYLVYTIGTCDVVGVMVARLYVGAHFPHQVLAGALIGAFLAPFLCIYLSDPYVWQYAQYATMPASRAILWHTLGVLALIATAVITFKANSWLGVDPQWTIKLAFRWCEYPGNISVKTTPIFGLIHYTGYLLGWALTVTPSIAQYRHYTKSRSLIISTFLTLLVMYTWHHLKRNVSNDSALKFYSYHFVLCVVKVPILLRAVPYLASWPFSGKIKAD